MNVFAWIGELIERVGAVVLLMIFGPIVAVLYMVIWLSSREGAFVTKRMTTADGREVEVFAFRTRLRSGAKSVIGGFIDRNSVFPGLPRLINVWRGEIRLKDLMEFFW